MKQLRPAGGAERHASDLVEDHEVELGQAFCNLPSSAFNLLLFEGVDQFDSGEEAGLAAMVPDHLYAKSREDSDRAAPCKRQKSEPADQEQRSGRKGDDRDVGRQDIVVSDQGCGPD